MIRKAVAYFRLHRYPLLMGVTSIGFYAAFGYDLVRTDYVKLLTLYAALFFLLIKLIQFEKWNLRFMLAFGLLFRLTLLWATPNLSQDFYRYIWDGQLLLHGMSPYLATPNELMAQGIALPNAQQLFEGMGALSAQHYSNYPPVHQLLFAITVLGGGKSIMGCALGMRLFIILADLGTLYFGRKLLHFLNLSPYAIFWYFLNPLVILELTGNLHFEGIMLFFFVWAIYLVAAKKWYWAAPIYALAILTKLVPLLFLPFLWPYLGFKKGMGFYVLVGITLVLGILPFVSWENWMHYKETIDLWFTNFEFNASIYNLANYIAVEHFGAKPWLFIKSYGMWVPILTIGFMGILMLIHNNKKLDGFFASSILLLTGYYLLSTTVHPWYLLFPLLLGVFTKFRFPVLWSALAILTYLAYSNPNNAENPWILALEYLPVMVYLGCEIVKFGGDNVIFGKK